LFVQDILREEKIRVRVTREDHLWFGRSKEKPGFWLDLSPMASGVRNLIYLEFIREYQSIWTGLLTQSSIHRMIQVHRTLRDGVTDWQVLQ